MDEGGHPANPATHQYPAKSAYFAVARMLAGIAVVVGLAVLISGQIATGMAALLVLVFLIYGVKSLLRSQEKISLSTDGLQVFRQGWGRVSPFTIQPANISLAFAEISALKLAYYSTRRDGEKGWMELVLKTPETKLVVESEIKGFRQIAMTCYSHAKRQGIQLSLASERNFAVLLGDGSLGEGLGQRFNSELINVPDARAGRDIGVAGGLR